MRPLSNYFGHLFVVVVAVLGSVLPSSDDPVAVRMVSDDAVRLRSLEDVLVDSAGSGAAYVGVVAVFAAATVTTVVCICAFVAVYVYSEVVRPLRCQMLLGMFCSVRSLCHDAHHNANDR